MLDRDLEGHRTQGNGLPGALQRGRRGVIRESLWHAERHEDRTQRDGQGQEHIEGDTDEVGPEVPEFAQTSTGEGTGDGERQGDAGRGGKEVLHGEAGHLRQVGGSRLARIGLPVRVRHEARRCVEGEPGRHAGKALRVQRQQALQAQDGKE